MHHFSHPHHLLQEVFIDEEFLCDGCHAFGHGKGYRCTICASSFQLHHRCATCPSSITLEFFHTHAHGPLTLVNQIADVCNNCTLCGDEVTGLYYTCEGCGDFHVHPLCTELPPRVQHTLHSNHVLTLRAASNDGQCMACGGACSEELWRYQCEQCSNFDVHIECAFIQVSPPPPPPELAAKSVQKSPSALVTDFQGQYPPPSATWYRNQQPQQPPIVVYPPPPPPPPPKPAQSNHKSPWTPMTDFQGQYPPPSTTWYHNQQPQQPPILYPPPPPPPQPAQSNHKSPSTPMTDFHGQYPPPSATWYHNQQPQEPLIVYPPPPPPQPAQSNHKSPSTPTTYFQGQYPPPPATWYHYQQLQEPLIVYPPPPPPLPQSAQSNHMSPPDPATYFQGQYPPPSAMWYPPTPPSQVNHWVNDYYDPTNPHYYPYPYYNIPQYPMQQDGEGQSSPPKKWRRRIYSVLSAAANVAMTALTIASYFPIC